MRTFHSGYYGKVGIMKLTYPNGCTAVQLVSEEDGEDIATLSVNLPRHVHNLRPGEFFVKTYSENETIAEEALASGAVEDTGARIMTEIGETPIWRCAS